MRYFSAQHEFSDSTAARLRGKERRVEPNAKAQLFAAVYADLKRMAHHRLERSGGRLELDTTSLVHESFLRVHEQLALGAQDKPAFFGYVARVMRSIVIDHIRAQQALKRNGGTVVTLTTGVPGQALDDEQLLVLNSALEDLARLAPDFHQLAELRYFAGLSVREIAELRGVSVRTVEREWQKAGAFLQKLMTEGNSALSAGSGARRAAFGSEPN